MTKRRKLYEKSVAILCNSYSNRTLEFGSILGSPIANLIAANLNYSVRQNRIKIPDHIGKKLEGDRFVEMAVNSIIENEYKFEWMVNDLVIESCFDKFFSGNAQKRREYFDRALIEIDATGYSIDDLIQVDCAFQDVNKWGKLEDEVTLIAGLIAAINALREIHEVPKKEKQLQVFRNLKLEPSDHITDILEKRFRSAT